VKRRIAIVGGGISGLTAAYVLQRDHGDTCETTLYESGERLGGIVETVRQDGFTVECGPDSWVSEKPWAEDLAHELGLAAELMPSNDRERRTYIAQPGMPGHNTLTALPDAMRMMVPTDLSALDRSPLFSAPARQAYRAEPARAAELRATALAARGPDVDESVAAFVQRHFGAEVCDKVAGPLLAGVFGGDIHQLSARALLAPFVAMEQEHGSLIAALQSQIAALQSQQPRSHTSVFTTLRGGLGTLVDRVTEALPAACAQLGTPVLSIEPAPTGWSVTTRQTRLEYDALLLATPLDATRALLRASSIPQARDAVPCLPREASSSLIVALGYTGEAARSIALPMGFGLLVAEPGASLLACTFMHQKFAARVPSGGVLLRAFFGSAVADALSAQADAAIVTEAEARLTQILGPLPPRAGLTVVRRWPRSLPQYAVGHLTRMRRFEDAIRTIPRLAVTGNSYRGVGLPDLIRDATAAAHRLAIR
jgi:oxygen-dependent protoporphyrinogen oxidase